MHRKHILLLVSTLLIAAPVCLQAFEEIGPAPRQFSYIDDRFSINVGAMHTYLNTQVQVNRSNLLPGTLFDFEDDLGLPGDQVRFFGDAMYRIGKHASFRVAYLDVERSSTKSLSKSITFRDTTFAANTTATAFVNTKYYLINYQYSFVRNAKQEAGLTAGFNIADISVGLQGTAEVGGLIVTASGTRSRETSFVAPVPLLGIFLSSQIFPRTFFRNTIQFMDIDYDDYAFKALNYIVSIDYSFMPNFGIGAGVYTNRTEVNKSGNFIGRFNSQITGTQVYLRYFY